eukprot:1463845-Karenia_brevis.AAC.1
MSLQRLEEEFEKRRLAHYAVETDDQGKIVKRSASISGAPGGHALQIRARLRRSDEAMVAHCPDDGYSTL